MLYRASAVGLRSDIDSGRLVPKLVEQFVHRVGHRPAPAEERSWERSLAVLATDLLEAGLGGVEALVEYQLPLTSKRADVVLCGVHPRTGESSYVVVELKQWSHAEVLDGAPDVCVLDGGAERLHPVAQVRAYCAYLADFIAVLHAEPHRLSGLAYLHNATDRDVDALWDLPQTRTGQLFTGQRRGQLVEHLRTLLGPADGALAADELIGSAVRPSKQLLSVAADEVQRREQFRLLDEQQIAYSKVMRQVQRARSADTKEVIVVSGGPGSGKSVIALSLMGELSRQGRAVLHATGSSAFTQTLRRIAGAREPRVKNMFKYFNQFIDAERNGLDVLILDEAHRIRETSANRYTKAAQRTGRPQVEELIDAARVPVFLLDQHQVVRPGEIGTIDDIVRAAQRLGLKTQIVDLDAQFRCGGSRAYESWVLRLLGLEAGGPCAWEGDEHFELVLSETPALLESRLEARLAEGYGARMSAGYCWDWSNPVPGGLVPDIVIGEWKRPWNNKKQTSHEGAPGTPFWASDPAGFGQVGCVYTAQGFEYDWSGVIIGPDLVWRSGRWVARPEFSHDTQVRRAIGDQFDRAVRNTYKVLLTRGMRGTVLYSTDRETQELLRTLVPTQA